MRLEARRACRKRRSRPPDSADDGGTMRTMTHVSADNDSIALVERALREIRRGKIVILTDDEDRENEGDLVMAAEKVTPAAVNFILTHARGMVCVPMTDARADALGLERMVRENRATHKTDYTVTVDAASGVTTGISVADQARTIAVLA